MGIKKFSFLLILVFTLTIISDTKSINFSDYLPLCIFSNQVNCSMKPQMKVNVDWDRFYGEWQQVFRVRNGIEDDKAW